MTNYLKTNKKALKSATNTDQSQGTAGAATQVQIKFSRLSSRKEREKMKYYENLDEIYEDYNENHAEQAPAEISESWKHLTEAFWDYLVNYAECSWKCGYMHAMKGMEKEV